MEIKLRKSIFLTEKTTNRNTIPCNKPSKDQKINQKIQKIVQLLNTQQKKIETL